MFRRIALALAATLASLAAQALGSTVIYDGTCPGANTAPVNGVDSTGGIADVAAVGQAGQWVDNIGGTWAVSSAQWSILNQSNANNGGPGHCTWTGSTPNDQSITIYSTQQQAAAGVRGTTSYTAGNGYLVTTGYGQIGLFKVVGTSLSGRLDTYTTYSGVGASGYTLKVSAIGSTISYKMVDVATGNILAQNSATDTTYASGQPFLFYNGNTGSAASQVASRVVIASESATSSLTVGTSNGGSTASTVALTSTASGATAPYSVQWHRSATQGFTPVQSGGGATAIGAPLTIASSGGSATYTDTPPSSAVWFYRSITTSADAQTATTADLPASVFPANVAVVDIGDSTAGGGTDDVHTLSYSGTITGGALAITHPGVGTTGAISGQPSTAAALQSIYDTAFGPGKFTIAMPSPGTFTITANGRYRFNAMGSATLATNTLAGGTATLTHTATGALPGSSQCTGLMASTLAQLLQPRQVVPYFQCVPGATAAMFAPSGGAYHASYADALAAAVAQVGAAHVVISHRFGINDGGTADPSASLAATDAIIAEARALGCKVVLHDTSYSELAPRDAFHTAYLPALDSRCDGVGVFKGQRAAYVAFANHSLDTTWLVDGTHYGSNGIALMGSLMADAIATNVFQVAGSASTSAAATVVRRPLTIRRGR